MQTKQVRVLAQGIGRRTMNGVLPMFVQPLYLLLSIVVHRLAPLFVSFVCPGRVISRDGQTWG